MPCSHHFLSTFREISVRLMGLFLREVAVSRKDPPAVMAILQQLSRAVLSHWVSLCLLAILSPAMLWKKDVIKFQVQLSSLISDFSAYNPLPSVPVTHCHSPWLTKWAEGGKRKIAEEGRPESACFLLLETNSSVSLLSQLQTQPRLQSLRCLPRIAEN